MASVDPTTIHPEHDTLTPENWDEWTEEQREQYLEAKDEELEADAEQSKAEMARSEREALAFLKSTTEREGPQHTTTVDLAEELGRPGEAPVTVRTKLTGELESKFDVISDEQSKDVPRIGNVKDALIDAICMLIVDDTEPDADRYDFSSRAVWEAYYYDEGSEGLMEVFSAVADPALERYEQLGNSRGRGQR